MARNPKRFKDLSFFMKVLACICCLVCYICIYIDDPFPVGIPDYQRDIVVIAAVLYFYILVTFLIATFVDDCPHDLQNQLLGIGALFNLTSCVLCSYFFTKGEGAVANCLTIAILSPIAAIAMGLVVGTGFLKAKQ